MEPNDQEDLANKILDASLKHYSAAEPRPGLDGRILTHLGEESDPLGTRRGFWAALAATATVVVVAATIFLIRRPAVEPQVVAKHAVGAGAVIGEQAISTELKQTSGHKRSHAFSSRRRRALPSAVTPTDSGPKLEKFPSPRPLSEQEEMLARYVRERPLEARLVARAQAELLQQDLLEFTKQNNSLETPDSMR